MGGGHGVWNSSLEVGLVVGVLLSELKLEGSDLRAKFVDEGSLLRHNLYRSVSYEHQGVTKRLPASDPPSPCW